MNTVIRSLAFACKVRIVSVLLLISPVAVDAAVDVLDFAVTDISLTPVGSLVTGTTFSATVTVTNHGGVSGNGGTLFVYTNQVADAPNLTTTSLSVTNVGSSSYAINGTNDPTLTLARGATYIFTVTAPGHPFLIKSTRTTGTGSSYTNGVISNGVANGTLTFTVPLNAPSTLYYICQLHSAMAGQINIIDPVPKPSAAVMIGTLAAGAGKSVTVTGLSSGGAGTKTFHAFIDGTGASIEADEMNNQTTVGYVVLGVSNVTVNGPDSVGEGVTTPYSYSMFYSDGSSNDILSGVTWSENSSYATVATNGVLTTTNTLTNDVSFTLTATYSNRTATKVITIQNDLRPDFLISQLSLSPTGYLPAGKAFTAYVTVLNQGTAPGDGGYLDIWTNQASVVTGKTHGTKYSTIGTITNGMSKSFTITNITAPSTNQGCTFRAAADTLQTTTELDESNNQSTLGYAVKVLSSVVVTGPTNIGEGVSSQYVCTAMYNDGTNEDVTVFATWKENSTNATITSTGLLTTVITLTTNTNVTVTATFGGKSNTLVVSVMNDMRPDFAITAVSLKPGGTLPANKTFTAYVTITNQGVVPGTVGYVDVWTNRPTELTTNKSHGTKYVTVGTLTNGFGKMLTITNLTAPFSNGTYTLRAMVDPLQGTAESDDANNQMTLSIDSKVLTNLTLTGVSSVGEGTGTTYIATAYYSDGSNEDVTAWTSWTENSTNTTVTNGLLSTTNTLTTNGSSTLTISFGGKTTNKVVTIQNDLKPDFLITELSMSPTSPVLKNASMTIYVTVQNAGTAAGNGGYIAIWTNRPAEVTSKTNGQSYQSVGTMTVGTNKTFTFTTLKTPNTNGTHVLRAHVDSLQSIAEIMDTNNQATLDYTTRSITNLVVSGPATVNESSGDQYAVMVFFSDGVSNDVTTSATWTENSSFASISSVGYLTTLAVTTNSSCKVSASYGSKTNTLTVTIQNM